MTCMKPVLITVYADLSLLPLLRSRYNGLLSEYRKERMKCFREENAAYPGELAEYCLMEAMLQTDPETELPLRIQTARFGKPLFTDCQWAFSLSHAGSFAGATVSDCAVGMDIEMKRNVREILARRICTEREWNEIWLKDPSKETFLRLFSAKESISKRSGEGIHSLQSIDIREHSVIQKFWGDYVLSVCSESTADWEVIRLCG